MAEQTPETLAERMGIEEGSSLPSEPTDAPAQRTTYVLLQWHEDVTGPKFAGAINAWEEIARIEAASRDAAFEEAKRRCPAIVPEEDGATSQIQLVPARFFRTVVLTVRRPEPQVEVEGL